MSITRNDMWLKIGDLAAKLGLNPKTIRYYEQIGLLPEPKRTSSGYRLYGAGDLERLVFIGKAKAIGLTLEEVREIMALRKTGTQPCEHVLAKVDEKIREIDRQQHVLADFRKDLVALREAAAVNMTSEACVCGIIERHEPSRSKRTPVPTSRSS